MTVDGQEQGTYAPDSRIIPLKLYSHHLRGAWQYLLPTTIDYVHCPETVPTQYAYPTHKPPHSTPPAFNAGFSLYKQFRDIPAPAAIL